MFGLKRAPRGTNVDSVSPRREKWVVAGLTLRSAPAWWFPPFGRATMRRGSAALQARVDELNAKQAAARKRVEEVSDRYPGDPKIFEVSNQAGWLTPEEWGEWQRLQVEIEDLGGVASWDDGSRHAGHPTTSRAGSHSERLSTPGNPGCRHPHQSGAAERSVALCRAGLCRRAPG